MKPRIPFEFASGETLSPTKLNDNFMRMATDLEEVISRRYWDSSFTLDFSGVGPGTPTAARSFLIKAPFAYEIVGIEFVLYEPTAANAVLSISGTANAIPPITATAAGATTRARETTNAAARVAANTEVTFSVSVWAATYDRCYAIIHIRHDRAPATSYGPASAPRFATGEAVAAAKVNTAFTDYETAVSAEAAATNGMRIHVFSRRDMASALPNSDRDCRVPSQESRLHSYDLVNHGAVGDDVTITVLDEAAATVSTTTVNGSGSPPAKTQGVSVNQTQGDDLPEDPNSDWKLRFSRAGAVSVPLAYVVTYWT